MENRAKGLARSCELWEKRRRRRMRRQEEGMTGSAVSDKNRKRISLYLGFPTVVTFERIRQ